MESRQYVDFGVADLIYYGFRSNLSSGKKCEVEFLAPSYRSLLQIRHNIESGIAINEAIRRATLSSENDFTRRLIGWWTAKQRGATPLIQDFFVSPLQCYLVETLQRGLDGEPILSRLGELEDEMRLTMHDTIERHLQRLPIVLLLPLTSLVFPSFMLLILGPILSELLRSLH